MQCLWTRRLLPCLLLPLIADAMAQPQLQRHNPRWNGTTPAAMAQPSCTGTTPAHIVLVQGKSSKTFKDELGYVGSEEIIHRNNICLLSIVHSLSVDPDQDGTPDPTPDEPSSIKMPLPDYTSMTDQAGIPGLTNQAWPHEQQNAGFAQDSYPPGSLPMQSQPGSSGGQAGFGANPEAYWHQPQLQQQAQHHGGSAQTQHQVAGHLSAAAPHSGPQGGLAPRPHHQQAWHGSSGGNTPPGNVKQEPGLEHTALPHRNPTLGYTSTAPVPNSSYASSCMPFNAGSFPPQDPRQAAYDPFPQSSGLAPPGTSFPPKSSFPPSTSMGTGTGQLYPTHQPPQHGYQGLPNQAGGVPPSQAYSSGYPPRDSKPAPAGNCSY